MISQIDRRTSETYKHIPVRSCLNVMIINAFSSIYNKRKVNKNARFIISKLILLYVSKDCNCVQSCHSTIEGMVKSTCKYYTLFVLKTEFSEKSHKKEIELESLFYIPLLHFCLVHIMTSLCRAQ